MSLLNDFENAKFSTKTILLFYVLIMPLFFISVYLFKPDMIWIIRGNPIVNLHFYFLVSICLVLSTLWLSMVYLLSGLTMQYYQKLENQKNRQKREIELDAISEKIKQAKASKNYRQMTYLLEDYSKKVLFSRKNHIYTSHSTHHYRITLIHSILYLSVAIAINHFWLNWKLQYFLLCLPLFVVFRIFIVKLRIS